MIRSVEEAGAWLEGLINLEKRPDWPYARLGLEPIRRLLERLEAPHEGLRVIHVAGSKGKGSTALLAEAVLLAAGERVGTFTSPHLERWTERVRLDGREVEQAQLAAAVERVRPHVEALREAGAGQAPTFFDATTAAAVVCFREAGVERVILDGGRLDSTNVVQPEVACITSIELEHTDKLGDTLGEIAAEKAGILKPGVPAVAGDLPREAREVVAARARELDVALAWQGRDFHAEVLEEGREGLWVRLADGPVKLEVRLPVLGAHQASNAALALACVRRAGGITDAALAEAAARGLARAELPGRVELLRRAPVVLVDTAHTAASARALARVLGRLPRRRTRLVLSISAGKHTAAILEALLPLADEVSVTCAEPARSLSAAEVAAAVRASAPGLAVRVFSTPDLALGTAVDGLGPEDCLCAAGSVYLAGIARRVLRDPRMAVGRHASSSPGEDRPGPFRS
jgi:dihydrofolate synthase/folylpolyglutamate synthase